MRHEDRIEWARLILVLVVMVLFILTFASLANAQSREDVETTIKDVAEANGLDTELALAIAEVESGLNPDAVGLLGEVGVYQLRPEYHDVARGDMKRNIETAIRYLVKLQSACSHYGDAFFICFNMGQGKRVRYPHLFPYYVKVMRAKQRLAGQ